MSKLVTFLLSDTIEANLHGWVNKAVAEPSWKPTDLYFPADQEMIDSLKKFYGYEVVHGWQVSKDGDHSVVPDQLSKQDWAVFSQNEKLWKESYFAVQNWVGHPNAQDAGSNAQRVDVETYNGPFKKFFTKF